MDVLGGLLTGFCSSSMEVGEGRGVLIVMLMSVVGGLVDVKHGFLGILLAKVTFFLVVAGLKLLKGG